MGLPCQPLCPVVIDHRAVKAHQGEHPPQEQVDLLKACQRLQNTAAGKAVICMVIDRFHTHGAEELVKAPGSGALENRIRLALGTNTVNHIAAAQICIYHLFHG